MKHILSQQHQLSQIKCEMEHKSDLLLATIKQELARDSGNDFRKDSPVSDSGYTDGSDSDLTGANSPDQVLDLTTAAASTANTYCREDAKPIKSILR